MVKLIIQKKKTVAETTKNVFGKISGAFLRCPILVLVVGIQVGALMWSYQMNGL
jgi:hypothetical protein